MKELVKDLKIANDNLYSANKMLEKEIERLNKRIKELEEGFKATTEDLCEESTKIEKAIEYIEKHTENIDRGQYYEDYVETYPVFQILKGSDKE